MKALITGASRGIGYAIAEELVRKGFECLLTAKHSDGLEQAAAKLKNIGSQKIISCAADLMEPASINSLLDFIEKSHFMPDALILDAGVFYEGSLLDAPLDQLRTTLEVNLISSVHLVKALVPKLEKSKYPRIVLIGSTASLEPYAYGPYYGISKWGVNGLACNLRSELKRKQIGVTLVTPGGTLTDLWAGEELPPNRLLSPSDIGKVVGVLFDLSTQAVVENIIVRPMLGDMHE
ncbi:MAG: SDR family NAD(P)-dependent oxidoreductase [Formivibrio sp.]|nr:SDR family NAD(P)-dependent oxidoreductase [Formivibrio sp.]